MSTEWERGFAAGYAAAAAGATGRSVERIIEKAATPTKRKRRASAYNRRYSAAFKKVAPRYKTKSGKWMKGGFAKANKAAHKLAKK
jgi:ribosomal protein L17